MEMPLRRRTAGDQRVEWVFPAPTPTGHISDDSLKRQHAAAIKQAQIERFVIYSIRHTCLTRWAESGMDVFTLKKLAGHANIATTMRYVHMSDARAREAMEKVWSGHKNGHTPQKTSRARRSKTSIK
jgi:integrase